MFNTCKKHLVTTYWDFYPVFCNTNTIFNDIAFHKVRSLEISVLVMCILVSFDYLSSNHIFLLCNWSNISDLPIDIIRFRNIASFY